MTKKKAIAISKKSQLFPAAQTPGANLIEGSAASSKLEFKKFHEIALKSANETKYWLSLLGDSGLADKLKVEGLLDEITQLANMIAAGVMKMKGKTRL